MNSVQKIEESKESHAKIHHSTSQQFLIQGLSQRQQKSNSQGKGVGIR